MNNESDLARGWLLKAASDISAARRVVDGDGLFNDNYNYPLTTIRTTH
jgi:hypothetical protein